MGRRMIFLLVVLGALIVCYGVVRRVAWVPDTSRLLRPPEPAEDAGEMLPPALANPDEYEYVTVEIEIPAQSEFPAVWTQGRGCPHTKICKRLGVTVPTGAGLPVFRLEPGGPAEKAGIQVGDRLGEPGDTPQSLERVFSAGEEPRTIEWTVRRPKVAAGEPDESEPAGAE